MGRRRGYRGKKEKDGAEEESKDGKDDGQKKLSLEENKPGTSGQGGKSISEGFSEMKLSGPPQRQEQHKQQQPQQQQQHDSQRAWGKEEGRPSGSWGQQQPLQPHKNEQQQQRRQQQQHPQQQQQREPQKAWGKEEGKPSGAWGQQQQQREPQKAWGKEEGKPSGAWGQQQQYPQQQQQSRQHHQHPQQQQQREPQKAWGKEEGKSSGGWGQQQQQQQKNEQRQRPQQKQRPQQQQRPQHQQHPQQQQHAQQEQQPERGLSAASITSVKSGTQFSRESSSSTSSIEQYKRTDINLARGTKGRKIQLETNYLDLIIKKMIDSAYHYDIKFEPDKPKRILRPAFLEYCRQVNLPSNITLAFDGKCNVYSPVRLSNDYVQSLKVQPTDEYGSNKEITVTLMETEKTEIDLKCLKEDYRSLAIYDKPMRALQCLDIVLRSPCYDRATLRGRAFYNPPPSRIDLGDGCELWYGIFQAAVLGERPLLNIDICHGSFQSEMHALDLVSELPNGRGNIDFHRELERKWFFKLGDMLRGLTVIYIPPASFQRTNKRYKVNDVKGPSDRETFKDENNKTKTVAEYFASKNYRLKYPKMPCIWVGNREKTNYIPIEFLKIEKGQFKKAGQMQVQKMIRYAATTTNERKQKTIEGFRRFNHNSDPTIKSFQLEVGQNFIKLEGRIINAPSLQYANGYCDPREGVWDPFRKNLTFLNPTRAMKCAVLSLERYFNETEAKKFADFLKKGSNIGVQLDFPIIRTIDMRDVDEWFNKFKKEQIELVFVVLSEMNQNSYSKVKQLAETKYGLLTQCIKKRTIDRCNMSTIQNILLKVNAKLNGLTHAVEQSCVTNILRNKDVMFIGADVTHPSPEQRSIPSVVGVAASHDLDGVRYNIQYRLQDPKQEVISNMKEILEAHLRKYQECNKAYPKKIIYYRDGVSDGQFPQIKKHELTEIDKACSKLGIRADITCVIVQKRHRTRFFPQQGVGKFNNVPPGTIVDTVITHPNECQFFMVSHQSIQGTAKPTKYAVIRDDSKFNIDDLQALTNNLCHVYTRCNRAVSYPAPTYYAHLVAYRGRVYIENERINLSDLEREYNKRKIINLAERNPMFFV